MSTDPRTEVELVHRILRIVGSHDHPHWDKAAEEIIAALDLDARDAWVRAETAERIARMLDGFTDARTARVAEHPPESISAHRSNADVLGAYRFAAQLVREYAQLRSASPSSSPVDAPSRPTGTPGPPHTCATKETT